jgi:hypothetical protein
MLSRLADIGAPLLSHSRGLETSGKSEAADILGQPIEGMESEIASLKALAGVAGKVQRAGDGAASYPSGFSPGGSAHCAVHPTPRHFQ